MHGPTSISAFDAMPERRFGEIGGIPPGSLFESRWELLRSGIHRQVQAGIAWTREGADSVILSGGYEDDVDLGDEIFYTGEGANKGGRQVANQTLTRGNLALAKTCLEGRPLRVVRRVPEGFRYDGLYRVAGFWVEKGKARYLIWRYHLIRLESFNTSWMVAEEKPQYEVGTESLPAERRTAVVQRLIRNTEVASDVKQLYRSRCQVCRETISTRAGDYSEAAHIRPLGSPHHGPDHPSNVLCLCPNHHVMFDLGGFVIREDFSLINPATGELLGTLYVHNGHYIDPEHLKYHRDLFTDDVIVPFEPDPIDFRTTKQKRSQSQQGKLFG